MPEQLGKLYVWDNVPEALTRVVKDGKIIHTDKIIVGQPTWPTPAFSADMKMVVFHPTWGVPDGIKAKELAPLLRKSSGGGLFGLFGGGYSAEAVLEAYQLRAYVNGRQVDANSIDWNSVDIRSVTLPAAAGAQEPARRREVHVPQQARRLHARHAGARSLRKIVPRPEPRLHAGGASSPPCLGPSR